MTQFPRIHSNGTDGNVLLTEYRTSMDAVRDAITAVRAVTVHGRDYYTIGGDAASVAYGEHHQRLADLSRIERELIDTAIAIHNQMKEA
mgnify:FL=1